MYSANLGDYISPTTYHDKIFKKKTATPPKFNIAPENRESQKERIIFQPSIFRGELLNFQGVLIVYLFFLRSLGIDFSDPRRGLPLICKRLKPGMQGERNEARQVGREMFGDVGVKMLLFCWWCFFS